MPLVWCHDRGALADPLRVCLEELKDALSPGTSGLPSGQKGSMSEIVFGQTLTSRRRPSRRRTEEGH